MGINIQEGEMMYEDAPANAEQLGIGDDQSNIVMYFPSNEQTIEAGQEYVMLLDDDQNVQQYRIVNVVGSGVEQVQGVSVTPAESPDEQGAENEENDMNEKALEEYEDQKMWPNWFLEFEDEEGKYINPEDFPQWYFDFLHDAKFEKGFCFQPVKSLSNIYRLGDCMYCKKRFILFKKKEDNWIYNLTTMKTHKEKCVCCRKAIEDKKKNKKIAMQNTNIAHILNDISESDDESYPDWFKIFSKNKNLIKSKYFKPMKQNITTKRMNKMRKGVVNFPPKVFCLLSIQASNGPLARPQDFSHRDLPAHMKKFQSFS